MENKPIYKRVTANLFKKTIEDSNASFVSSNIYVGNEVVIDLISPIEAKLRNLPENYTEELEIYSK